jgi:hypothetical protein
MHIGERHDIYEQTLGLPTWGLIRSNALQGATGLL